jgi:hypothetical protein
MDEKMDEKYYIQMMDENPSAWMSPTSSKIMDDFLKIN